MYVYLVLASVSCAILHGKIEDSSTTYTGDHGMVLRVKESDDLKKELRIDPEMLRYSIEEARDGFRVKINTRGDISNKTTDRREYLKFAYSDDQSAGGGRSAEDTRYMVFSIKDHELDVYSMIGEKGRRGSDNVFSIRIRAGPARDKEIPRSADLTPAVAAGSDK